MRITNAMMASDFLTDANNSLSRVVKFQKQVASGKRIQSLSDDPIALVQTLRARNKISSLELYRNNISTSMNWLQESETAVYTLNNMVQNAYETLISATSDTNNTFDKSILSEEMKNFRDEVLSLSNTTLMTSYLFGSYNITGSVSATTSKETPFIVDETTGYLLYNRVCMYTDMAYEELKTSFDNIGYDEAVDEYERIKLDTESTVEDIQNAANNVVSAAEKMLEAAERAVDIAAFLGVEDTPPDTELSDFTTAISALNSGVANLKSAINQMTTDPLDTTGIETAMSALSTVKGDVETTHDDLMTAHDTDLQAKIAADQAFLAEETKKSISIQVGTDQYMASTITGPELLGTGENNLYYILDKITKMCQSGASAEELSPYITVLQNKQKELLTLQTDIGGRMTRLNMLDSRYTDSILNYKQIKSDYEDVDEAEAIINLTTAQTTYNAALAAGANILKISLIDFIS